MYDLENEEITVLPERFETSDYNYSAIAFSQGNLGIQLAAGAVQLLGQGNGASVTVIQVA